MQSHLCCSDTDAPCVEDRTIVASLFRQKKKQNNKHEVTRLVCNMQIDVMSITALICFERHVGMAWYA